MSDVTSPPDAGVILEQVLRTYACHRYWSLRGGVAPQGGFSLLWAAGLGRRRARAINTLARRTAAAWRKAGEPVSDDEVRATAQRLLV